MNHKRGLGRSFRDEHTRCIRVIMDCGNVREGQIEMPHIGYPGLPTFDHNVPWNVVAALADAPRDAIERRLRRWQP